MPRRRRFHFSPITQKIILRLALAAVILVPSLLILSYFRLRQPPAPKAPTFKSSLISPAYFSASNSLFKTQIGNKFNHQPIVAFSHKNHQIKFTLQTDRQVKPINQDNQIIFKNILENTDLVYQSLPTGLKEELVIKSLPQKNTYLFDIELKNTQALTVMNDFKAPVFYDQKNQYSFHFQKPFAIDASSNRTDDVSLILEPDPEKKGHYLARLTISNTWLNHPQRTFPIRLDPTVVYDTTSEFASGTFNQTSDSGSGDYPYIESYFQETPLDPDTVGLWHFDESVDDSCSGGEDACDESANSFHATSTSTSIVSGLNNYARETVADSAYLTVPDNDAFTLSDDYTIEAWINPDDIANDYKGIVGTYNSNGFIFALWNDGIQQLSFWGGGTWINSGVAVMEDGQWKHVAYTRQGTLGRFYINGENVYTTNGATAGTNGGNLYIGCGGSSWTSYCFDGKIDDLHILKRAKTPEEIRADALVRQSSTYTSPVIELTNVLDYTSFSWNELGSRTGNGETATSSSGLVGQWNFNETSGTTANNDAEGTSCGGTPANCDGTLTGFSDTSTQDAAAMSGWTSDNRRWGAGALMFDGSDDYVDLGTDSSLNITSSFTLEAWVKMTADSGYVTRIIEKDHTVSYALGVTTGRALVLYIENGPRAVTPINALKIGRWYHLAATFNDDTNEVKIYLDGQESPLASGGSYTGSITGSSRSVKIGKYWDDTSHSFEGNIDSVRIFNRALPAHEILSHSQLGNIEFLTRTSYDNSTWEAWKPTSALISILSLDSDATNWSFDSIFSSGAKAKTDDTATFIEGGGSLKVSTGILQNDANMRGLWHLDETSSSAYNSSSVSDLTLTANNSPTSVDGFAQKARGFDNTSNQYFSCTDANCGTTSKLDADSSTGWSYGAWVYPTSFSSTTTNTIMGKHGTSSGFLLSADSSGQLRAEMGNSSCSDSSGYGYQSAATLTANQWSHAVVTVSAANPGVLKIYLNGDLKYTSSATAYYCDQSGSFYLGSLNGLSDYGWNGYIDEAFVSASVYSDQDVHDLYRAGFGHTLSRTISSTDLSDKTQLPFYFASPNLGTPATLTFGESNFANNEPDSNTLALWHFDETDGESDYLKDATGNGYDGTPDNTTSVVGQIGRARHFASGNDISLGDQSIVDSAANLTVDAWVRPTAQTATTHFRTFSEETTLYVGQYGAQVSLYMGNGSSWTNSDTTGGALTLNEWNHVAWVKNGTTASIYINGQLSKTGISAPATLGTSSNTNYISTSNGSDQPWLGTIDELRISDTARTAEEIRATYEAGLRTHPLTVNFKASLDSDNLIADSSDTSFTIDATDYGFSQAGDHLYTYDKIIVLENVDGTQYIAQGTVSSITASTGAVNVSSWDTASTFPSGGFTSNATVIKWQKNYIYIKNAPNHHQDAITNLTLRFLNPKNEATVLWLDDLESNTNYLTDPTGGDSLDSTVYPYFQYQAVFNSLVQKSPKLAGTTLDYTQNTPPPAPDIDAAYLQESLRTANETPTIRFSTTDSESDDLIYQVAWDTDSDFNSASTATSDSDAGFANIDTPEDTSPFNSGETISYTFSTLTSNTYYYRVRAKNDYTASQYSSWSDTKSFTIDTSISQNDWYQTRGDQFALNTITNDNITGVLTTTDGSIYQGSGNYTYSKTITITNSGSELTDYDVLVELDTATLISNSKMQSDCDDIRFYDSDQSTQLDFWLEQGCNTASTQFWVSVPSIPNGDTDIYTIYGNNSVTSGSQSWSGNFILMSNASCPAGWTRVTDLDDKFPRGNSVYGGSSTTATHSHTGSGSTGGPSAAGEGLGGSSSEWGHYLHTHTYSFSTSTGNHTPPYVETIFCQKTAPLSLINSNFLILHTTTLPSGWTQDTAYNEAFPLGSASYSGTGGSTTHTHSINNFTTSAPSAYSEPIWQGGSAPYGSWWSHTHSYSSGGNMDTANNLPPYYDFIFANPDTDSAFTPSVVSFFDDAPPLGWTQFTSLNEAFPRGNNSAGGSGGSATHTHTYSITTGGSSDDRYVNSGGSKPLSYAHTHTISGTSSSATSLPPYFDLLTYQRKSNSEISLAYGSESSNYAGNIFTDAITASAIKSNVNVWKQLIFTDDKGDGTIIYQIYYDNSGTPTLVPDEDLAGNSSGFTTSPVSLTSLFVSSYPTLYLKASFSTSSESNFPTLYDWNLTLSSKPNVPTLDYPTYDSDITDSTPDLKTTGTDDSGDYLQYKIELCTNLAMTFDCQTFDQTSSQTGWSGQNSQSATAYTSGTQAVYTVQSELIDGQTYYWRSYAIDPGDSNTWGDTQGTPFHFTYYKIPGTPQNCTLERSVDNSSITVNWLDVADNETSFRLEGKVDNGSYTLVSGSIIPDTEFYLKSDTSAGHTYQYRVRANNNTVYSPWCTTAFITLGEGNFQFEGLQLEGLKLD